MNYKFGDKVMTIYGVGLIVEEKNSRGHYFVKFNNGEYGCWLSEEEIFDFIEEREEK